METKDIMSLGQDLINLARHVDELEEQVRWYESRMYSTEVLQPTNCYINDTPIIVYRPKATIALGPKCTRCNSERLIPIEDSFNFSFVACECSVPKVHFSVEILSFDYLNVDGETYIYHNTEDGSVVKLNKTSVFEDFEESQLTKNPECLFYDKIENCEEFCRRKNNES